MPLTFKEIAAASVPNAPADHATMFLDVADGVWKSKDESGTVDSLGSVGPAGPAGPGIPSNVNDHGNLGSTETFDYDSGDGAAHTGVVNAALAITLTGWPAADPDEHEAIISLYLVTDGTGGYGAPTFGAEVINAADLSTVWDDTAGALNVIRLFSFDGGTSVYIDLPAAAAPTPDLDAVLAESSGQDIADALTGAATPDAGNVFATMDDLSGVGGGLAHSYLGYNTAGGSTAAMVANTIYFKKVTPGASGQLTGISFYVIETANGATPGVEAGVWDDSSGPLKLLAAGYAGTPSFEYGGGAHTHVARWYHIPVSIYLTGGTDYWIGVQSSANSITIHYDGSGSDDTATVTGFFLGDVGATFIVLSTTTNKYSIRADYLS